MREFLTATDDAFLTRIADVTVDTFQIALIYNFLQTFWVNRTFLIVGSCIESFHCSDEFIFAGCMYPDG